MAAWKAFGSPAFPGLAALALLTGIPSVRHAAAPRPRPVLGSESQSAQQLELLMRRGETRLEQAQAQYDSAPNSFTAVFGLARAMEALQLRSHLYTLRLHRDPELRYGVPTGDAVRCVGTEALSLARTRHDVAYARALLGRVKKLEDLQMTVDPGAE